MDIYAKLFEVLFPVFFIVAIGYFLGKKNPKLDTIKKTGNKTSKSLAYISINQVILSM